MCTKVRTNQGAKTTIGQELGAGPRYMKFLQLSLEGIDSTWAPVDLAGVCSIVPMSGTQITETGFETFST